jgi:hypothetical protein
VFAHLPSTTEPVTRVAPPRYETKKNVYVRNGVYFCITECRFGEVVRVREKTLDELLRYVATSQQHAHSLCNRESDVPKLAASSSQFTKTVNAMSMPHVSLPQPNLTPVPRTIGTFGNRRDALDKMAEKASEEPPMPKPTTATLLQSSVRTLLSSSMCLCMEVPNYVSKGPVLARGNSKTEVNLHISELAAKIKAEGGSAPNISDLPAFLLRRLSLAPVVGPRCSPMPMQVRRPRPAPVSSQPRLTSKRAAQQQQQCRARCLLSALTIQTSPL